MKKIGLTLGWGGAKWYAHIGVIKFLEENNYEITEISGTSMGALVGAIYVAEKTKNPENREIYKKLIKIAHEVEYLRMIDFERKNGWLTGYKSLQTIKKYVGNLTFGETKIPLTVAAHELGNNSVAIFNTKNCKNLKIADAVRASTSIPGIFMPWKIDNKYYIDGGLIKNLPIEFLSEKEKIAVSVLHSYNDQKITKTPRFDFKKYFSYSPKTKIGKKIAEKFREQKFSDFKLLKQEFSAENFALEKIVPIFTKWKWKNLTEEMIDFMRHTYPSEKPLNTQNLILHSLRESEKISENLEKNAIILRPDMNGLGTFSYKKADEIITRGYEEAKKILQK